MSEFLTAAVNLRLYTVYPLHAQVEYLIVIKSLVASCPYASCRFHFPANIQPEAAFRPNAALR